MRVFRLAPPLLATVVASAGGINQPTGFPEHTMNPQARPFAYPTVTPLSAPHTPVAEPTTPAAPSELDSDARWNQWAEKGRREQAAFKEKARVIAAIGGVALSIAVVGWAVISL